MQFFGIGTLMAFYCFVHYVQSPVESLRARDLRLTDMSYTATVLPVIVLFHYIPNFGAYLHWINPETRHMWEWVWQPFPVFVSVVQYVLSKTVAPRTVQKDRLNNTERDLPTICWTIGSLCALSTAVWHYTVFFAPYSMWTLFVPNLAATKTGDEYIRLFIQFDELFSFSACLLWLLYLFGDMKRAGMLKESWVSIVLKGVATFVFAGPGVTIGAGWLWRERVLATKWDEDTGKYKSIWDAK